MAFIGHKPVVGFLYNCQGNWIKRHFILQPLFLLSLLYVHSLSQYPLLCSRVSPSTLLNGKFSFRLFHIYIIQLKSKDKRKERALLFFMPSSSANWICHPISQWDLWAHISFHCTIQSVQTDYEGKYENTLEFKEIPKVCKCSVC